MIEFKTVDAYIELAQVSEVEGRPFVALDLYRQAFNKATYLACNGDFTPPIRIIWSDINKIGENAEPGGVVETAVMALKTKINETARCRGIALN